MKYFECIGPGKGKISGYVQSLTPHKKWRPCSCWTPSLQRSLMHRRSSAWRTRVTLRLTLEPLQAAPASQRSGTSQQPRTPASAPARTHTSLPAQRQLTLSGSLLPQRQLTLPSMAIAERRNKANLQLGMLFYGCGVAPSTCHAVLCLSVHCRAWLRLGLASSLCPTMLCVAVC